MGKVEYNGIKFDSELEVEYYKQLIKDGLDFVYHPKIPIQITKNNYYTPDFVVFSSSKVEIIETKGYNPYSKMRDDMIHQVMLAKPEQELREWLYSNFSDRVVYNFNSFRVVYRKIKYLKAYGFVDWDFKNPNTIANKRKEKINEQNVELKELRKFKKDTIRYFSLHNKSKLTPSQKEFIAKYLNQFYTVEE